MAKITIVVEDEQVDVTVTFDPSLQKDEPNTAAHVLAGNLLVALREHVGGDYV